MRNVFVRNTKATHSCGQDNNNRCTMIFTAGAVKQTG